MERKDTKFCIIGGKCLSPSPHLIILAGKYGSALGYVIQHQDCNSVTFLVRKSEQAEEINTKRTNSKVSELIKFNESVSATTDIVKAVKDADYLFLCMPA